jgi:hypothetical protein
MSSSLINATMQFHNTDYPSEYKVFDSSTHQFGTLNIQMASVPSIDTDKEQTVWNIGFSVDISGSMSDKCKDGRDKMHHIRHTLCGIIRVFSNITNVIVNIYVQAFDSKVEEIIDFVTVAPENIESLISKIESMFPRDETDLKKPLEKMNDIMTKQMVLFPKQKFAHIMLTDGEDTRDNTNGSIVSKVSQAFKNVFIGFGTSHNSVLMEDMSNGTINDYRFIDKLESSGLVYGEIIHDILYSAIESISIVVNNGEIYDWRTNTWEKQIDLPSLPYNVERTFHIRSTSPELVTGKITGIPCHSSSKEKKEKEEEEEEQLLNTFSFLVDIDIESTIPQLVDLTQYMYRQKVQELLFMSKHVNSAKRLLTIDPLASDPYVTNFKTDIRRFFDHMKSYVKAHMLSDDPFWKVLLDDVYVAMKVFNHPFSHMYTHSRQNSQGRQQTYAVTNIEDSFCESYSIPNILSQSKNSFDSDEMETIINSTIPYNRNSTRIGMQRSTNNICALNCLGNPSEDMLELEHELSDSLETSYQTPEIMKMMRDVSCGNTV